MTSISTRPTEDRARRHEGAEARGGGAGRPALAGLLGAIAACAVLASCASAPVPAPSVGAGRAERHAVAGGPDLSAACACAEARRVHGWCRRCGRGWIAGVPVESALLFDYLDPHGHDIDPGSLACPTCREALAEDGWCGACGFGFRAERLHASRLSWAIAGGETFEPPAPACAACRGREGGSGWCDRCGRGLVGNVLIRDRRSFEAAAEEVEVLRAAVLLPCEFCAIVRFSGGECRRCAVQSRGDRGLRAKGVQP